MSVTVNEVHLAGRAGKDAERFGNGPVKFSLATGGGKNKKTGGDYPTEWHNCLVWDESYLNEITKGVEIELWGRIHYASWDDHKTGEKKYKTEIVATKLVVGAQSEGGRQIPSSDRHDFARSTHNDEPPGEITDQDIPF